jgi:hypothetical protein
MAEEAATQRRTVREHIRGFLYRAPWNLTVGLFRLLYGFRLVGGENIPSEGPFILAVYEPSLIGTFASGWLSIVALRRALSPGETPMMAFMQDQLFALSYFRDMLTDEGRPRYGPIVPHSAGRMALSLVDGYRALRDGGLVITNPEGDGPWDGRPLPMGTAAAWLGLHTAAPIVPAVCSIGGYDIWPRWAGRPYLSGKLRYTIGQPFRLTESPRPRVSSSDIEEATDRVRTVYHALRYGAGGFSEWVGEATLKGAPVDVLPELQPEGPVVPVSTDGEEIPVGKRGVAQLLWRCPICRTNDALAHKTRLLGAHLVSCRACDTRWRLRHVPERDFRLTVVAGAPGLMGLDMALSQWYDEMKRDFRPEPIPAVDADLLPGEELYLEASGVSLAPHKPSSLLAGDWTGREAPQEQPGRMRVGEWESVGEGRLLLTSRRMVWQGADREVDFDWSHVRAIYLWLRNTLGILYGTARYRIGLGTELGLKWLTYAGTLARRVERDGGFELTVSQY